MVSKSHLVKIRNIRVLQNIVVILVRIRPRRSLFLLYRLKLFKIVFIISLFLSSTLVVAQSNSDSVRKTQIVLVEALGSGGFYSLNFETSLKKPNAHFRIGASYWGGFQRDSKRFYSLPMAFLFTKGKRENKFVFGPGLTFARYSYLDSYWDKINGGGGTYRAGETFLAFTFRLGYRYQPAVEGAFFEASIIPLHVTFLSSGGGAFLPTIGISLGRKL